jgi:hypothetical protein
MSTGRLPATPLVCVSVHHTGHVVRDLRFVVPLENENRQTDLLAVLISTDPVAVAGPLNLGDVENREVTVSRDRLARRGVVADI